MRRGGICTCLPPSFMNWENECLKSSQGKPTWNCSDHKRALSLSLFSSSPFQAESPGAGVTGRMDGPDPPAVQVQCPDTHQCPACQRWWGQPGSLSPLPPCKLLERRCSWLASEAILPAPTPLFLFLVETFKSNRCRAHGN